MTGPKFREASQDLGHQRVRVLKAIRLCPQDDDDKRQAGELLLVRQTLVHCEEDVVVGGLSNEAQEFAVLDARPTGPRDGQDIVAG